MSIFAAELHTLRRIMPLEVRGTVASVRGMSVLVHNLALPVGSLVRIESKRPRADDDTARVHGEVVGFDAGSAIVMLFAGSAGIAPGMTVIGESTAGAQTVAVGPSLLGRVIDGLGRPIDTGGLLDRTLPRPLNPPPIDPLRRSPIREPLPTGVRAIDGFLTVGRGQRVGIFSAAGVGKSTLLGMIARTASSDVNVIALIGERGREVREFIEESLGPDGLKRSVVIVATGDESPLLRVRAALVACTVAEYFRDAGAEVLLMMDSITRFAQAQRQIGLASGEQPATRGYTPSVFALLPSILERAGTIDEGGSITGLYAVLVEGDDLNEPISDAARGVLDGHVVLSRRLAARGHFPAIDVLESISRVADDVCDQHHIGARRRLTQLMAAYAESEELINIGAYARGSNPDCDVAIALRPKLLEFLRQGNERTDYPYTCRSMIELCGIAEEAAARHAQQGTASAEQRSQLR